MHKNGGGEYMASPCSLSRFCWHLGQNHFEIVSGLVTLTTRDALDSNLIVSGHFMAFEITAEAFVEIMKYVPTLLQKGIKLDHG